jgi:hypothetical protein
LAKAETIVKTDDRSRQADLFELTARGNRQLSTARDYLKTAKPVEKLERLLAYKTNHKALMLAATQAAARLPETLEGNALYAQAAQTKASFPDSAGKIDAKLSGLAALPGQVKALEKSMMAKSALSPPDYLAAGRAADGIVNAEKEFQARQAKLSQDLQDMSVSVDRILVDMKVSGVKYYHKYKIVRNGKASTTEWQAVSATFYRLHKGNLGMTIYSKPEGQMDEDAVRIATPPGYNYVGNSRYGQWRYRGSRSYWEFYGQYRFMQDVFWGPSYYRPIYRRSWTSYRHNLRRGQPYYGKTKQYGSAGSTTKRRYKTSAYIKAKRSTSYSGSKYSGSGRRSGGYRGSRYRSSSYSGGGK